MHRRRQWVRRNGQLILDGKNLWLPAHMHLQNHLTQQLMSPHQSIDYNPAKSSAASCVREAVEWLASILIHLQLCLTLVERECKSQQLIA